MELKRNNDFDEDLDKALDNLIINESNIQFFLKVLRETNDPDVWLVLPLEIAKTKDQRLLPVLLELLTDRRTQNYRGNFLSALNEYDYSSHYELLIDLMRNDNWEVRNRAACMLAELNGRLSPEEDEKLKKLLEKALEDTKERYSLVLELCEDFNMNIIADHSCD